MKKSGKLRIFWGCVLALALLCLGCVGPQQRGDHAMEMEQYDRALDHYEEAIEAGSRDPDLYFRAARAAQHQGAFAKAERYFSQSLRYGGGDDVARALAQFYVQTSNFSQAVRIFQYLLPRQDNPQPLYSDMGTALMYAGNYLDAESYLLIAQQLDPADPVPYINLGVLYDRYLRNRPKAIRFYQCYEEMGKDPERVQSVRLRLREIDGEGPVDTSRVNLICGEIYRMAEPEYVDLRQVFDLGMEETQGDDESSQINAEQTADGGQTAEGGGELDEGDEEKPLRIVTATGEDQGAIEEASQAFESGRYDEVAEILEAVPESERSSKGRKMLADAYRRMGQDEKAAETLESLLRSEPTPEVARLLIEIYDEREAKEQKERICERFSGWPDYTEALESCD